MEIKMWNHLGEENSNIHLSVRELYLYFYVSSLKRQDNVSVTTIDMLQDYLPLPFVKTIKDNKNIIREVLNMLMGKELISVKRNQSDVTKIDEVTNKCLLYISINGDWEKGKFKDYKGYESIDMGKVNSFKKMEYLYIYYVIAKYKNKCIMSYSRWSTKLAVSDSKAKSLIKEMKKAEIIFSVTGDYSNDKVVGGQKMQDSNKYSLTPFTDEEKSNMQKKKEKESQQPSLDSDSWGKSSEYNFPTGNWLNGENLDVDDYVIYFEHKAELDAASKDFITECDKKRKRIMKGNSKFKYYDDKYTEEAKEKIKEIQRESEKLEKEHQVQIIMDQIKSGKIGIKHNPLAPDDEIELLDSFNQVEVDHIYVEVQDTGDEDIFVDHIIRQILTGNDGSDPYYRHEYSNELLEELLNKLKELFRVRGRFESYPFKTEISEYRERRIKEINSSKSYDEFHEGDKFNTDDDRNVDLENRIREIEKDKQVI